MDWSQLQAEAERSLCALEPGGEARVKRRRALEAPQAAVLAPALTVAPHATHVKNHSEGQRREKAEMLERAVQVLRMRGDIHVDRYYKKEKGWVPEGAQEATVVDDAKDFYSRVRRKDRKASVLEEYLGDVDAHKTHRRARKVETSRLRGGKREWKRKQMKRKRLSKQRVEDLKVVFKGGY